MPLGDGPVGRLSGHKDDVLCLDAWRAAESGSVASGGVEGLWVWDSGTLQPTRQLPLNAVAVDADEVTSVKWAPPCVAGAGHVLYASAGTTVACLDLRCDMPRVHAFAHNQDEVNQIDVDDKGKLLAAADDNGDVRVMDLFARKLTKTLRGKHTGFCNTVCFRHSRAPASDAAAASASAASASPQLLSGGLDSLLVHWDATRGKSIQALDMNELEVEGAGDTRGSAGINPPWVYSVDVDSTGRLAAAGLGDASVALFSLGEKRGTDKCLKRLTSGHAYSVGQVMFWEGAEGSGGGGLVTGGNDEKLCAWTAASLTDRQNLDPAPADTVAHGSKVNWLTALQHTLFVADQTPDIAVYKLG